MKESSFFVDKQIWLHLCVWAGPCIEYWLRFDARAILFLKTNLVSFSSRDVSGKAPYWLLIAIWWKSHTFSENKSGFIFIYRCVWAGRALDWKLIVIWCKNSYYFGDNKHLHFHHLCVWPGPVLNIDCDLMTPHLSSPATDHPLIYVTKGRKTNMWFVLFFFWKSSFSNVDWLKARIEKNRVVFQSNDRFVFFFITQRTEM